LITPVTRLVTHPEIASERARRRSDEASAATTWDAGQEARLLVRRMTIIQMAMYLKTVSGGRKHEHGPWRDVQCSRGIDGRDARDPHRNPQDGRDAHRD